MKFDVTDEDFEEKVIEQSKQIPVIVQFWASWCGPCQMLKPIMEKVSDEYEGKIVLAKLSVEENPSTAQEYQVRSIPHVVLFKDGKIVDEFIGAKMSGDIKAFINKNIA